MSWEPTIDGGVLLLDAASTHLAMDLELQIIASDGLTWGMWVVPDTGAMIKAVPAGQA